MNIIIEIHNARGEFMQFLKKHGIMDTYYSFFDADISHVYYAGASPGRIGYMAGIIPRGALIPPHWKGVKGTVEEFIPYYEGKVDKLQTMDTTYMPSTAGPEDYWLCSTTVTRDPDSGKVTHLHTKFLPTMNAYNTLVIKKDTTFGTTSAIKKPKPAELVVIPFEVRLGRSKENVKAELLRLIPEDIDVDDVEIMIQEIF